MWRGGLGFGLLPFQGFPVCGAISLSHAPFPHPAHRTGRAVLPHPALGQGLTLSPTGSLPSAAAVEPTPAFGAGIRRGIASSRALTPCACGIAIGAACDARGCPRRDRPD